MKVKKIDGPYALLAIPDFRNFLTSRLLLFIGLEIQAIIIGWQLYQITHDPLTLGLVGLFEALPALAVAPFAGHFADTHDRRTIIRNALFVAVITSFALVIISLNANLLTSNLIVSAIYVIILIQGFARGFAGPSMSAFVTQLIPREKIAQSAALNSSSWIMGSIAGPALGGLIYGFTNATTAYSVGATILAISFLSILRIKSYPMQRGIDTKESFRHSLFGGWKFVRSNQLILAPIAMDMFAVFFGGAVAILPVFASDILRVGAGGLGILRTAPAIGAIAMGLYLTHNPMRGKMGSKLLLAVCGFGISIIIFAVSKNFYLSFFALGLSGMFDNVSVIIRSTVIQLVTPDNKRGRTSAIDSMFIITSNEIGAFESGTAAKLMGAVPSVIFGGCMTILTVGATALLAPKLRSATFEELQQRPNPTSSQ